jgi:glutamate-1-semialdehyde aminotransferase/spore coat polysaccharide biosynthesis protein SpsF (cytidylyltransferase family)
VKIIGIVQARTGSTRLPGKVMRPIQGVPMIELLIRRLAKARRLDRIILATSADPGNQALADHVRAMGYEVYQGSETDVLDRYYQAAKPHRPDAVVRITGDCPLVDPELVDRVVARLETGTADYVANTMPPTYPDGLDVEAFSFEALASAASQAHRPFDREHVTPFIRESGLFATFNVAGSEDLSAERWTVDEPEDLEVVASIFAHFAPRIDFGWQEVLALRRTRPEFFAQNRHIKRNEGAVLSTSQKLRKRADRHAADEGESPMRTAITDLARSKAFSARMHDRIPGGAHTYSKGDDQFPELAPAAIDRGKGCRVWDIDGNEYLDCSMGLTAVSLGHAYGPVLDRVRQELDRGVNFQRPSVLELEMAERFLGLVPHHDMVKFAKNGSTVTTAAVKLARAKTGRKLVAFPGNHPFYSYDDWFIGTTACNKGVPEEITRLSVTFNACDLSSLTALFEQYPDQIACVITEPEKSTCGEACACRGDVGEFLRKAIDLAHAHGALFILDEMITGFKTAWPGSMAKHHLRPDMATWGKGIANGFAFCALTGRKDVMELGGIRARGQEKVFLISTTHGAETHAMAAALATIDEFEKNDVVAHNHAMGRLLADECGRVVAAHALQPFVQVIQCEWMPTFAFCNRKGEPSAGLRTLFMQEMIRRGVLFQGIFVSCYSHSQADVSQFVRSFEESLNVYTQALDEGFEKFLIGEPAKPVFRKTL